MRSSELPELITGETEKGNGRENAGGHTHPVPDVEETLLVCQVEHQEEAHCISEERCSETAEPGNMHSFSDAGKTKYAFCLIEYT